jgi:ABC-type molybdenum transport system ATPase subunit/photorepair protein PhrA
MVSWHGRGGVSLSAAMIYVTHDVDEIPASVTQLLALDQGRVRYIGPRV